LSTVPKRCARHRPSASQRRSLSDW
jgi:hypothetical protein